MFAKIPKRGKECQRSEGILNEGCEKLPPSGHRTIFTASNGDIISKRICYMLNRTKNVLQFIWQEDYKKISLTVVKSGLSCASNQIVFVFDKL